MTSQPGKQTFTIHILPDTLRNKGNQKVVSQWNMTRGKFFFKNHEQNEAVNLVSDPFLFFKKALYEVKAICLQLILISVCFDSPQLGIQ